MVSFQFSDCHPKRKRLLLQFLGRNCNGSVSWLGCLLRHDTGPRDHKDNWFLTEAVNYSVKMPKVRRSRIKYPEGWELIEPTLRELDGKMREAELDPHDGKRKCEALWPIFKITHQKSRYIYDLYYRRNEISKELYEFCLDQGYGDRNLIAKWKKDMNDCAVSAASSPGITTLARLVCAGFQSISGKRRLLSVCIVVVEAVQVGKPRTNFSRKNANISFVYIPAASFSMFTYAKLPRTTLFTLNATSHFNGKNLRLTLVVWAAKVGFDVSFESLNSTCSMASSKFLGHRAWFGCVIEAKAGVTPMGLSTGVPRTDMGWLVCVDTLTTAALVSRFLICTTHRFSVSKPSLSSHEYLLAETQSSQFSSQHKACEAFCGDYVLDTFFWVLKQEKDVSETMICRKTIRDSWPPSTNSPKKEEREGNLNLPSVNQAHLHAGLSWPRPCSHHSAGQNTKAGVLLSKNFGTLQSSEPFEFLKIQDNVGSWLLNLLNIKSMWA
ncbi:hypothetical protein D5086_009240 [Populus alba]|uniref:Uncharacterized protein n=1 Tax=Populus alba TaxID=43335 RepID=A0ACC4CK41_POPAL